MKRNALLLLLTLSVTCVFGQNYYMSNSDVRTKLLELERSNKNFVKVSEIVKTDGNQPIMMVTLANGDASMNPAVVVVGGVSGKHPLGAMMAYKFVEDFTSSDSLLNTLGEVSYYVFPNMSPDALAQIYGNPRFEREGNASPTDDDRDGRLDEDPYEDMNNDGVITWIRVEDPTGDWIIDPLDSRAMKKVDKSKGEKGNWRLLSEGRDNDGDGKFNEDGPGGVAFNMNFTYDYPWFQAGAGEYQVSEKENRALLDFLYERTNIFAVISFGPSDNLSSPMKFNASNARKRIVSSMLQEDVNVNEWISGLYLKETGTKGGSLKTHSGGFMEWAYFHFGRFSFSTPGFYIPDMKRDKESKLSDEVSILRWLDSLNIDGFTDWQAIDHPDFKNKKVELGGIHPYVASNPPIEMVEELAQSHTKFVTLLASKHAESQAKNIVVEPLGKGVYRVSMDFFNSGELPALSQMGERVKWVMKPKVSLKLASGMNIISGNAVTLFDQLKAGQKERLTWLIQGKGTIEITAGAPQMGQVTLNVELK